MLYLLILPWNDSLFQTSDDWINNNYYFYKHSLANYPPNRMYELVSREVMRATPICEVTTRGQERKFSLALPSVKN